MQYVYETQATNDSGDWKIYGTFQPYYTHRIAYTVCI